MFFMGNTDAAKLSWMLTFAAAVTGDPAAYAMTAGEASDVQVAVDAFQAAFLLGGVTNRIRNDPATYTKVTVADEKNALATAQSLCQSFVNLIRANDGIPDATKTAAGVPLINSTRVPRPAPSTAPLVSILAATAGLHTLVYADSSTPDSKAKPFGATGLQVYTNIGTVVAPTPAGAIFSGTYSRNPAVVSFDPADAGKIATHFARWISARSQVGPWSVGVSLNIAF